MFSFKARLTGIKIAEFESLKKNDKILISGSFVVEEPLSWYIVAVKFKYSEMVRYNELLTWVYRINEKNFHRYQLSLKDPKDKETFKKNSSMMEYIGPYHATKYQHLGCFKSSTISGLLWKKKRTSTIKCDVPLIEFFPDIPGEYHLDFYLEAEVDYKFKTYRRLSAFEEFHIYIEKKNL